MEGIFEIIFQNFTPKINLHIKPDLQIDENFYQDTCSAVYWENGNKEDASLIWAGQPLYMSTQYEEGCEQ